jgi:hypothetical protein
MPPGPTLPSADLGFYDFGSVVKDSCTHDERERTAELAAYLSLPAVIFAVPLKNGCTS